MVEMPPMPSGAERREIDSIQCPICGCGWKGGLSDEGQAYVAAIMFRGWGLQPVPDCNGKCACHTGEGIIPALKIEWRYVRHETVGE